MAKVELQFTTTSQKAEHQTRKKEGITRMKKLAMVLILVFLTPAMSSAAGKFYREGDLYTVFNVDSFKDYGVGSTNGFTFQLGYDMSKYLALEGHLGMAQEKTLKLTSGADYVNTTARTAYASVVARGNLRFDKTTVFGFVGMTYRTLNGDQQYSIGGNTGSSDIDDTNSGATYGIGIDLFGSRTTAITLKAVRVYKTKKDDYEDIDATMLGITHYIVD